MHEYCTSKSLILSMSNIMESPPPERMLAAEVCIVWIERIIKDDIVKNVTMAPQP